MNPSKLITTRGWVTRDGGGGDVRGGSVQWDDSHSWRT